MDLYNSLPKPFFVLAPMDDVTDTVFRQIIASLAPPDLYLTEFVNVDGLQSPGREKLIKKLQFTPKEKPIFAQLWGLKPENFYKTVKEIVDSSLIEEIESLRTKGRDALQGRSEERNETYNTVRRVSTGASDTAVRSERGGMPGFAGQRADAALSFAGVDINMGCPVKTVVKNGACAALINNRELASKIIDAAREAAGDGFPISVKTRVGFSTTDMGWLEFLLSKKLDLLSIHGRTAKQLSNTPADWKLIGQVAKMRDSLCPSTLIVGNGDVMNRVQGLKLAKKYKLDGVMIGRGVFHDPFVFAKKSPWEDWNKEQKIELFKKHIKLFSQTWLRGEYKFDSLKKFAKVYLSGFDGASEFRTKFMMARTPDEALDLLSEEV